MFYYLFVTTQFMNIRWLINNLIYSSALGKDKSYFLKKKHVDFTILPFHSLLITGFVTKLAQRV